MEEVCVKLDVVVPTYNRSGLLQQAVKSLQLARVPDALDVTIIVVDNNSQDNTEAVVTELQEGSPVPIWYVKELKQGSSHTRNAGIGAGTGDLIGFIDDDEKIVASWYEVVAREFAEPSTEFIGGPYFANWAAPAPVWLPPGYHAVIGVVDPKPRGVFDENFPGIVMSGNAVIRRSVFDRVGGYAPHLGRSGKGLLCEEDAELYRRLLAAGVRGYHVPDLIIYHYIPAERLTRNYHRRWCYWRGVSQGLLDREQKEHVSYSFGVPRYRIGRAVRGMVAAIKGLLRRAEQGRAFASELAIWDLAGFIHGKHFVKIDRYYAKR